MEEMKMCERCKVRPQQYEDGAMYPDFCKACADDFKRVLDKAGLLNKLKRKYKIKK